MSLFKVREFWSFDLKQLANQFRSAQRGDIVDETVAESNDASDAATAAAAAVFEGAADTGETHVDSLNQQNENIFSPYKKQTIDDGRFIISLGRFHSIGDHDVFVAATLDGFICIIQVPDIEQEKRCKVDRKNVEDDDDDDEQGTTSSGRQTKGIESYNDFSQRQLLVAKNLGYPVVDVKCAYPVSALKQSLVVLSFEKLIIYHVKSHQIDLMSASFDDIAAQGSETTSNRKPLINENLFTHELEEHYRFNLLVQEVAMSMVILDKHSESSSGFKRVSNQSNGHHHYLNKNKRHNDKVRTDEINDSESTTDDLKLQLPQRDIIVIQYSNQALFTMIDNKKVVGHYKMLFTPSSDNEHDDNNNSESYVQSKKLDALAQFLGPMPMAFLRETSTHYLVVSNSDRQVFCLNLEKLFSQAKQNVMKRVAQNLLFESNKLNNNDDKMLPQERSSTATNHQAFQIELDLCSISRWQLELVNEPLRFATIPRHSSRGSASSHSKNLIQSELFVMSRYTLDLISSSGQHIWSQRLETPMICTYNYVIESIVSESTTMGGGKTKGGASNRKHTSSLTGDSLFTLVCTDCLSSEKSNLLIMKEDQIVWNSLLGVKPIQLLRLNLSKMSGVLAALDFNQSKVILCYIGTNVDLSDEDMLLAEQEKEGSHLNELDLLDEALFVEDQSDSRVEKSRKRSDLENGLCCRDSERRLLLTTVRLEALNHWPNVSVNCEISLKLDLLRFSGLLQNVVVTLVFDDLICFQANSPVAMPLSDGATQFQLGNCWPDMRESLKICGKFYLRSSNQVRDCEKFDEPSIQELPVFQLNQTSVMSIPPKSLKVSLYLSYIEAHSGSSIQEESFLLPLNMVAQLVHLDYSSGQNQTLEDVQANLYPLYKRKTTTVHSESKLKSLINDDDDEEPLPSSPLTNSPYYLSDIFFRTKSDIVELMDELIEADLVCRGLFDETVSLVPPSDSTKQRQMRMSTLENVNLLAQSLDCRLKYKGQKIDEPPSTLDPVVLMSIALRIPSGLDIFNKQSDESNFKKLDGIGEDDLDVHYPIVWLHLIDLAPSSSTSLPSEFIKQHLHYWKIFDENSPYTLSSSNIIQDAYPRPEGTYSSILMSVESDHPVPVLLLQNHLIERIKKRIIIQNNSHLVLNPFRETDHDSIEISTQNILRLNNFIATSVSLHDYLRSASKSYKEEFEVKMNHYKEELTVESIKFQATSNALISFAKRLSNLPKTMQKHFQHLSALTNNYQLNINRLLTELEKLKLLEYNYSKIPRFHELFLEEDEVADIGEEVLPRKLICWIN